MLNNNKQYESLSASVPVTEAERKAINRIKRRLKRNGGGGLTKTQVEELVRMVISRDRFVSKITTRTVAGSVEREARVVVERHGTGRIEEVIIGSRGKVEVRPWPRLGKDGGHDDGRPRSPRGGAPTGGGRRRGATANRELGADGGRRRRRAAAAKSPSLNSSATGGLSPSEILKRRFAQRMEGGDR